MISCVWCVIFSFSRYFAFFYRRRGRRRGCGRRFLLLLYMYRIICTVRIDIFLHHGTLPRTFFIGQTYTGEREWERTRVRNKNKNYDTTMENWLLRRRRRTKKNEHQQQNSIIFNFCYSNKIDWNSKYLYTLWWGCVRVFVFVCARSAQNLMFQALLTMTSNWYGMNIYEAYIRIHTQR